MITLKQPKGVMWYWEHSDGKSLSAPVIIALHGSGERSNTPDYSLIQRHGLPKLLKLAGYDYLDGFTILTPQENTTTWGYVRDPNNPDIIKFLRYVRANYNTQFVMVTGLSMGGDGSWCASYLGDEKLVTAIVPVSGKGDYNLAKLTEQRGVKVWGIHGDADKTVPVSDGKRPINGMISEGGEPKWTLIPGGGHNDLTWDVAFSITDRTELGGTTIYKWFKSMCANVDPVGLYVDGLFIGESPATFEGHTIEYRN